MTMDPRVTDPGDGKMPENQKVGLITIGLGVLVAAVAWMPKKVWVGLKKAFIYMTAGRHVEMKGDDKDDLIKDD